jgi:hypothetical protein
VVGFSHSITDGALQAYLSMLLPDSSEATMERSGAIRLDLVSSEEAEPLLPDVLVRRLPGYRLYVGGEPGEIVD